MCISVRFTACSQETNPKIKIPDWPGTRLGYSPYSFEPGETTQMSLYKASVKHPCQAHFQSPPPITSVWFLFLEIMDFFNVENCLVKQCPTCSLV